MIKFIDQFIEEFPIKDELNNNFSNLDRNPLNQNECCYVFDFTQNKIIFQKGFDQFLGYSDEEIDLNFIIDKYHSEDRAVVINIIKAVIYQFKESPFQSFTNFLNMSYRFRRSDGTYVKILSKCWTYTTNDKNQISSVLIKYSDISFIDHTNIVKWSVDPNYIDKERISNEIYGNYLKLFTSRELEVIIEVFKGILSKKIAETLNISEYTVATHRKNIFKKSNCHNREELLEFCMKNGIV